MLKEIEIVADCIEKIDSKYRLVNVTAKRARQLMLKKKETAQPFSSLALVETSFKKPTTIALDEFDKGAIGYEVINESMKEQPDEPDE